MRFQVVAYQTRSNAVVICPLLLKTCAHEYENESTERSTKLLDVITERVIA
jgi:hypothetical protein